MNTPSHFSVNRIPITIIVSSSGKNDKRENMIPENYFSYENLYRSIRDAILVADTNRKIIHCNPAFEDIFGYSFDEIYGKQTSYIYKDEEEFRQMGDLIKNHINEPNFIFSINYRKKTGEVFKGETNVFYMRNEEGDITGFVGMIRDITERIKMKNNLIQLKNMYQTVFRANPDAVTINRLSDGNYIEINEGFEKIMGYRREDILGKTSIELGIWKNPEDRKALVKALLTKGYMNDLEAEYITSSGDIKTGLMSARIIEIDGEKSILAVTKDISEKKRNERKLIHLNEILKAIRNVNQLITIERNEKVLIKKATGLLTDRGYSSIWIALYDDNDNLKIFEEKNIADNGKLLKAKLIEGEKVNCQQKAIKTNGIAIINNPAENCNDCPLKFHYNGIKALSMPLYQRGRLYGTATISMDGDLVNQEEKDLFVELINDISFALYSIEMEEKRQLTEKSLMASEERYRSIFTTAPNMIISADVHGKIVDCNDQVFNTLGYEKDEIIGHPMIKIIDKAYKKKAESTLKEIFAKGSAFDRTYKMVKKSGGKIDVSINSTQINDPESGSNITICIIDDVSDEVKAKKKLMKLNEELDQKIRERTKNLEEKNKQLERLNKLFVGREFRIKELKEEIKKLKADRGKSDSQSQT